MNMKNKNLKDRIKNASVGNIINFSCFLISIILGVISFFCPPKGIIDSSVLMFIAEVGIFATISRIPEFIKAVHESNTNLEISHGETTIKIEGDIDEKK